MKILIAVLSCHAYRERAEAIRDTWAKEVPEGVHDGRRIWLRFFVGKGPNAPLADEIHLDAPDDYRSFPLKVQATRRWALEQGCDFVFKCDDDTYVRPERLLASGFEKHGYTGRLRGPSGGHPAPYCSGFAYWLSRSAIAKIVDAPWNQDTAEDRFTGNLLLQAGIRPEHDYRYAVVWSKNNALSFREPPLEGNPIIAACEYPPHLMRRTHEDFKSSRRSMLRFNGLKPGPLDRVCLMVKTFLRDGYLFAALQGIQKHLPDTRIVLVDDGAESFHKITSYADLRLQGHDCIWLPFDSGFGAKANAAIERCDREYVLIGSDDFDFGDKNVRPGIERMVKVLDSDSSVHVASGRVDGRAYESLLEIDGENCKEVPGFRGMREAFDSQGNAIRYHLCDLTVNYSLIRRKVFEKIRWDEDVKIGGGEHGSFFVDLKRAGFGVCLVEGVNIRQMPLNIPAWYDRRYPVMRARARANGLPCVRRRGITRWTMQDGRVELA